MVTRWIKISVWCKWLLIPGFWQYGEVSPQAHCQHGFDSVLVGSVVRAQGEHATAQSAGGSVVKYVPYYVCPRVAPMLLSSSNW